MVVEIVVLTVKIIRSRGYYETSTVAVSSKPQPLIKSPPAGRMILVLHLTQAFIFVYFCLVARGAIVVAPAHNLGIFTLRI
jgi:hypothetical protein